MAHAILRAAFRSGAPPAEGDSLVMSRAEPLPAALAGVVGQPDVPTRPVPAIVRKETVCHLMSMPEIGLGRDDGGSVRRVQSYGPPVGAFG